MRVDFVDFMDYVREYSGKIVFFIGVILLIIGVSTLTALGTQLSATSFFLGIIFVVFGIFAQIGLFSVNFRSWNGLGTILICISIILLAFSISVFQFINLKFLGHMQVGYRGRPMPFYRVFVHSEHSYILLGNFLARLGLVLLVVGILVKIFYARKS